MAGMSRRFILIFSALFCLLLSACGQQECDFCGQKKFCKEFDVMGTTRLICRDCLNDPSLAVSGNVARSYAELYENGTLEYPEQSPLRPMEDATPTEEENPMPDLEMIMNGYDPEAEIRQRLLEEQAQRQAERDAANAEEQPYPADNAPVYDDTPKTMGDIIAAINASLQSDNMCWCRRMPVAQNISFIREIPTWAYICRLLRIRLPPVLSSSSTRALPLPIM